MDTWASHIPEAVGDGRYALEAEVGQGGFATVWRARDTLLDAPRAVKILQVAPVAREALRRRLRAEARAMARIHHPHVLKVYDMGTHGPLDWVVMELAEGGSLAQRVKGRGPLTVPDALRLGIQVLSALGAAHEAGIVHRDVKPENILLGSGADGVVALLGDFGIALVGEADHRATRAGVAMGTLSFMAPEQRLDARAVGPPADLYAMGATLYHLCTGANPVDLFTASSHSARWEGVPENLKEVLARAVRHDPAERFSSARDMAAALSHVLDHTPEGAMALTTEDHEALAGLLGDADFDGDTGVWRPAVAPAGQVEAPSGSRPSVAATRQALREVTGTDDGTRGPTWVNEAPNPTLNPPTGGEAPARAPAPPVPAQPSPAASRGPTGTGPWLVATALILLVVVVLTDGGGRRQAPAQALPTGSTVLTPAAEAAPEPTAAAPAQPDDARAPPPPRPPPPPAAAPSTPAATPRPSAPAAERSEREPSGGTRAAPADAVAPSSLVLGGTVGGLPAEVTLDVLRGGSVRGQVVTRIGSNRASRAVVGRWDGTRLTLDEVDTEDNASGSYDLLTGAGGVLRGDFVRRDGKKQAVVLRGLP